MIEIKNRFSGEIIISLNITSLSEANLRGADLCRADLRGADLRWADLCWADGNGVEIVSFNLGFKGVITKDFTWIGCRKHPTPTWWEDSEKESGNFTESQKEWRKINGTWVRSMIKAFLKQNNRGAA